MALTPIWNATLKNGKLIFNEGDDLDAFLQGLEGKHVEVLIRRFKKDRTVDQHGYYFSVICGMVGEEMGTDLEETHSFLKGILLPYPKTSLTQLDCAGFSVFIDACIMWAATTLGLIIPEPQRVSWQ